MDTKTNQCTICDKEFNNRNVKTSLLKHQIWCKKKNDYLKHYNLDKDSLAELYKRQGSVLNIVKNFNYNNYTTNFFYNLFEDLNIKVSVKQASNHKLVKEKRKLTHLEQYGCEHNFSKNSASRNKWEKRLLEKEGITNVFQRKEVQNKIKNTIIEKYGVESAGAITHSRGKNTFSSIHKEVVNILSRNNIIYSIELKLKTNESKNNNRWYYAYDILLENKKIIEVNGDYWHGNPSIYKADDIILKGSSKQVIVSDKWKYDKEKINFAKSLGYKVLVVWESDLKKNKDNTVKEILEYAKS